MDTLNLISHRAWRGLGHVKFVVKSCINGRYTALYRCSIVLINHVMDLIRGLLCGEEEGSPLPYHAARSSILTCTHEATMSSCTSFGDLETKTRLLLFQHQHQNSGAQWLIVFFTLKTNWRKKLQFKSDFSIKKTTQLLKERFICVICAWINPPTPFRTRARKRLPLWPLSGSAQPFHHLLLSHARRIQNGLRPKHWSAAPLSAASAARLHCSLLLTYSATGSLSL